MSTPLPVPPSKVAVTAIRGLIVATTCSLALVTEDRRRRIKNAHNAIQNGQRIRAAKNYHAGGASIALAIEENAALFDHADVPRSQSVDRLGVGLAGSNPNNREVRSSGTRHSQPLPDSPRQTRDDTATLDDSETRETRTPASKTPASKTPALSGRNQPPSPSRPFVDRQKLPVRNAAEQWTRTLATSVPSPFSFPQLGEIQAMAAHAASSKDPQVLKQAVDCVLQALAVHPKSIQLHNWMMEASALLCRTCQEMGNIDSAWEILRVVLARGPLSETAYYSFEPLRLLDEHILPHLDTKAPADPAHIESLTRAVDLYLPQFIRDPKLRSERGFAVGKRLLELSFAAKWLEQADALYRRCRTYGTDNGFRFTEWFISQLGEAGDHKRAVDHFLLTYSNMSPPYESVNRIGNCVVTSVIEAHGYEASPVLRMLDRLSAGRGEFHTTWVMKLLEAHWASAEDFDETAALFTTLRKRGLRNVVQHVNGIWRVMLEIAYKAGRPDVAESYLVEATAENKLFATDTLTVMLLAQLKARRGDWEGVEQDLRRLSIADYPYMRIRVSQRFVPILKMYAESHTVAETDAFLRRYVTEVNIPVCEAMVTFMTKYYGAVRDFKSLIAWLEYCAGLGFKGDAIFTNSILSICRKIWKLNYRDLHTLYLQLLALDRTSTDGCTDRIMVNAALKQALKQAAGGRERRDPALIGCSRTVASTTAVFADKCHTPQETVLKMKEELILRRPENALRIYRHAVRNRLNLPPKAVRLAVQAALKMDNGGLETAYDLIKKAEQRGVDTKSCVVPIITTQLDRIDPHLGKEQKYIAVRQILDGFEKTGTQLSDVVLNQAAFSLLKADHGAAAIELALMAAEAHRPGTQPCYNIYNFAVLVWASAKMERVDLLRSAIATGKASPYWTDTMCLQALKSARRDLLRTRHRRSKAGAEALAAVKDAIEHCVKVRAEFMRERCELQSDMLEIVRAAADSHQRDAGRLDLREEPKMAMPDDLPTMVVKEKPKPNAETAFRTVVINTDVKPVRAARALKQEASVSASASDAFTEAWLSKRHALG